MAVMPTGAAYAQVYVANESNVNVWFDDVTIRHWPGLQVQENHYDPFGLDLAGLSRATPGLKPLNQYQWNGKEKQNDFGLGWSHQDWRFFDPQIGRWHVVDPLSDVGQEMWSPYSFAFDNALRYADADGRKPGRGPDPAQPKVIMVFYHGGPTGSGEIKRSAADGTGGTGRIYSAAVNTARNNCRQVVGAIIAPALTEGPGVETGERFLKNNYSKGDQVIIYGYSYGGDNAVNLAEKAKELGIPVSALVTVDSSDGPGQGMTVNNNVPDNVGATLNVYQTNYSGQSSASQSTGSASKAGNSNSPGSRGYPATAKGKNSVQNVNASGPGVNHGNIQDRQKGRVLSFLNNLLQ